jgi:release factor glutamine methyltransferase
VASVGRLTSDVGGQGTVLGGLIERISPVLGVAESRELVAAYLDKPRHWASLNGSDALSAEEAEGLLAAAARRAAGAPMPYAVGKANFRSLTLAVDERVLIPRPETELLVDLVLARAPRGGVAIDVGTGSGAIAIALATEGSFDRVIATDISQDALAVARANAASCGAEIEFAHCDLLGHPKQREGSAVRTCGFLAPLGMTTVSVVVSNPPYVAFEEARALPPSVRDWEPSVALYSPRHGLEHTARLVAEAASVLQDEGLLALEVDARRASLVAEMVSADDRYAQVAVELDLTGRERFVLAVRRTRSRP